MTPMKALPPLPDKAFRRIRIDFDDTGRFVSKYVPVFTAEQMTEYAQQAAKAERKAALLWAAELCHQRARALRVGYLENGCDLDRVNEATYLEQMLRAEAERIK